MNFLRAGDQQSNLAEALTTHAVALARLQRSSEAFAALNEAIGVAAQVGDPEKEGIASLRLLKNWQPPFRPVNCETTTAARNQH